MPKRITEFARKMRKEPTVNERRLRTALKDWKQHGIKFRFQNQLDVIS